ncbi:hypothetical protein Q4519_15880 [Motilimonas sp. 1_MG-2023]|uniref:hypothetical protein n=1 Tax=Motilimonas sp. 1_MG-2023 TaxID=3062672 RepID=UPI0026E29233|nr:hypothetical protein [Motilimonas sp. 1_MG-2023]MDO6527161.1 hypothetical protein [Motilimonas sp. 1_MG-2023]
MDRLTPQFGTQRRMTYFVIVALLFQIFISATVLLNPALVTHSSWLNSALGDKVLICTSTGFKWVDINELVETNQTNLSENTPTSSNQANTEHDSVTFTCPLLKACQYYALLAALLVLVLTTWLARNKIAIPYYLYICSLQKVYLLNAPKTSPPAQFLA